MNIFVLDYDTEKCAKFHCDKHVVKMILETTQLLSTVHRVVDGELNTIMKNGRRKKVWTLSDSILDSTLYQATHINHPCTLWAKESLANYKWLTKLGLDLCDEYTFRYGKIHKCQAILKVLEQNMPTLKKSKLSEFALAMPEYCKSSSAVDSYRKYYINEKSDLLDYRKRELPYWICA